MKSKLQSKKFCLFDVVGKSRSQREKDFNRLLSNLNGDFYPGFSARRHFDILHKTGEVEVYYFARTQ